MFRQRHTVVWRLSVETQTVHTFFSDLRQVQECCLKIGHDNLYIHVSMFVDIWQYDAVCWLSVDKCEDDTSKGRRRLDLCVCVCVCVCCSGRASEKHRHVPTVLCTVSL